ncbi:MAG: ATPase domain-containing protein [Thermoplasmata archaeon]
MRCRVCGERLRPERKPGETSPQKPVVLERVMTGEVFTAVLGDVKSKEKHDYRESGGIKRYGDIGRKGPKSRVSTAVDQSSQVEDWMARSSAAMELEMHEKAIEYLDRVLELSPKDPKAWYKKGVCLGKLGNHVEAIKCYEKAIEEDPRDAQLWYMKGKSQKEIRSYKKALFSVDRALELRPSFTDAWYSKGGLLQILGKLLEAYVCFLETLKLDPNHTDARLGRDEAEAALMNKGLQSLISRVTSWDDLPTGMHYDPRSGPSTSKTTLVSLAEDALSKENFDESLYFYEQALDTDEDDSFLWEEKGNLLSKMGRYKQAMECYQRSIAINGKTRQIPRIAERDRKPQLAAHTTSFEFTRKETARGSEETSSERNSAEAKAISPRVPSQEQGTEAETPEQEIRGVTTQQEDRGQDMREVPEVSTVERKLEEILSSDQELPSTEEEPDEGPISVKMKVKHARGGGIQRTYVKGFDEALGGGIPRGHVVLITGAPGTMKSSLAFSILYNQALKGRRTGLYVTLEQSTRSLVAQAASLGMEYDEVRESLRIFDLAYLKRHTQMTKEQWMDLLHSQIRKLKRKLDLSFLVIDSLDALLTLGDFEKRRSKIFKLFEWLRQLEVTTLVISERSDFVVGGNVIQSKSMEDFLADGIFHLRLHLVNDVDVQRRIRCLKMREMNHNTGYMALSWDDGFFNVTRVVRR